MSIELIYNKWMCQCQAILVQWTKTSYKHRSVSYDWKKSQK